MRSLPPFRVIIAGGRDFDQYSLLEFQCDRLLVRKPRVMVVSGGARGADMLGERFATRRHYPIKRFSADWERYGNAAGPIRNKQMAEYADALIAFWDGHSRGTRNMITLARTRGLAVRVVRYH